MEALMVLRTMLKFPQLKQEKLTKAIGIISYLPDDKNIRSHRKKLLEAFEEELANEKEISSSVEKASSLKQIYVEYEKLLKRTLSPLETSIINDWIGRGYSPAQIIDALKECLSKGKKTFKSIDKVLLQWQTRDDIEKAGVSATSDKWDKNIEKTLKIAKAKWIDD